MQHFCGGQKTAACEKTNFRCQARIFDSPGLACDRFFPGLRTACPGLRLLCPFPCGSACIEVHADIDDNGRAYPATLNAPPSGPAYV